MLPALVEYVRFYSWSWRCYLFLPQPEHGDRQRFKHIQHLLGQEPVAGEDMQVFIRRTRADIYTFCRDKRQVVMATCNACNDVTKQSGHVRTINLSKKPFQFSLLWRHEILDNHKEGLVRLHPPEDLSELRDTNICISSNLFKVVSSAQTNINMFLHFRRYRNEAMEIEVLFNMIWGSGLRFRIWGLGFRV